MKNPTAQLAAYLIPFGMVIFLRPIGHLLASDLPTNGPVVSISEIRIDQPSEDTDEYFELAGVPGDPLDQMSYLVIGDGLGGSGVIEAVIDLTGQEIPASGFFIAAEGTFSLGAADLGASLNFENSDNVTHLLVRDFSGANGDDLDRDDDGTLDLTPWAELLDRVAVIREANPPTTTEYHYGPPQVGPDGSLAPGHVYYCSGGWRIGGFDPAGGGDSPGAANPCEVPPFGICGDPEALIHAVQGSGFTSPLAGISGVVLEGVVVGDFQDAGTGLGGFFLQEEDGETDADPMTSEGIFVQAGSLMGDVQLGDVVRVQGTIREQSGMTSLVEVIDTQVCGTGSASPVEISLPVSSLDEWEAVEGMLVAIDQALTVSDHYSWGRYGEVLLSSGGRLYQPTALAEPGDLANALRRENELRSIQLDDGSNLENPLPLPPYAGPDGTLRAGDTISSLTGVTAYSYGNFEIHPTAPVNFTRANPRPAAAPEVGGSITVASFNVHNYFTTVDEGDLRCGPLLNQECRGADSIEEFNRQSAKIIAAIIELNADIVGLVEVENDPGDAPIADLVNKLNAGSGAGSYAGIDTGPIGGDAIRVALIYQPASVTPMGEYAVLDSSVDERFLDDKNRPALAQTFRDNATGDLATVVVNHLKSKSAPCDDVGDPDIGDGQGNCNLTRTRAAEALVDWLASDPTHSGSEDFLITGDLNAYPREDPIDAITRAGFIDLIAAHEGNFAYTYNYSQAGCLDYALSSRSLADRVSGAAVWHMNADEPSALDYNDYNQPLLYHADLFRSSDHDPVVIGIAGSAPPVKEDWIFLPLLWK